MAKKQSSLNYVYMVGMLLVLISCFLPLGSFLVLKGTLISTVKNGSGILQAGALITLIGTIAGIIVFFVYLSQHGQICKVCFKNVYPFF